MNTAQTHSYYVRLINALKWLYENGPEDILTDFDKKLKELLNTHEDIFHLDIREACWDYIHSIFSGNKNPRNTCYPLLVDSIFFALNNEDTVLQEKFHWDEKTVIILEEGYKKRLSERKEGMRVPFTSEALATVQDHVDAHIETFYMELTDKSEQA